MVTSSIKRTLGEAIKFDKYVHVWRWGKWLNKQCFFNHFLDKYASSFTYFLRVSTILSSNLLPPGPLDLQIFNSDLENYIILQSVNVLNINILQSVN